VKSARLFANSQNEGAKHMVVLVFFRTTRGQRGLFLLFEGSRLKKNKFLKAPFNIFKVLGVVWGVLKTR